jgi:glutaminase
MDYKRILEDICLRIEPFSKVGEPATYIPALSKVNPDRFGMCLCSVDGNSYAIKDADVRFSIQSISKVFALAMCLSVKGEALWSRVGKEPSGTAFNSLVQLEAEHGMPRNPFMNAGALVLADIILTSFADPENDFLSFVRALCGSGDLEYDIEVARSEYETGYLNAAIANLLKYHGTIECDVERVLHFYFLICSLEMNCRELAAAFLAFANHNRKFEYSGITLTSSQVKRMNAVMQTCGFYDEAGEFSYLVGLPGKSGVGGGIAAIYPLRYSVAVWSPRLNGKGNSVMGMKALEFLTTETEESIF